MDKKNKRKKAFKKKLKESGFKEGDELKAEAKKGEIKLRGIR